MELGFEPMTKNTVPLSFEIHTTSNNHPVVKPVESENESKVSLLDYTAHICGGDPQDYLKVSFKVPCNLDEVYRVVFNRSSRNDTLDYISNDSMMIVTKKTSAIELWGGKDTLRKIKPLTYWVNLTYELEIVKELELSFQGLGLERTYLTPGYYEHFYIPPGGLQYNPGFYSRTLAYTFNGDEEALIHSFKNLQTEYDTVRGAMRLFAWTGQLLK